jgi:Pyruvate/2-oxoacid:ferredoxin oxidoreductase delta subunit
MFGSVPGFAKGELHKRYPKPYEFAEALVDVFSLTRPGLSIMDGVLSMEGHGPSSGTPRWLGVILVSRDAVAVDTVACKLIGADLAEIPTNRVAALRKLGASSLDDLELSGVSLEQVSVTNFQIPSNFLHRLVPKGLLGLLRRHVWIHPHENRVKCQICNLCVESCPVGAIRNSGESLRFDYTRCITCLCCHEICPHDAIEFDMSWIAKRIS